MSSRPIIACKRCKAKKLKCDDEPHTCKSCSKAGQECLHVDSRSRREYARGYVEQLQNRIAELNRVVEASKTVTPSTSTYEQTTLPSPVSQSTYHGEGSAIGMARLVEASIATRGPSTLSDVGFDTAKELREIAGISATPARLPPVEVARQLFDSYLDGPHRLHPFLHRSELLEELRKAYSQPPLQPGPAMFRIHMVFAIGAVALVRAGVHNVPPMDYYAAAMDYAGNTLGLSGTENIQAVLLVLLFSLQHDIGIGSKWDLARVAMRICIEDRLHQPSGPCEPIAEQMRRRIFWACYVSDRHSSSVLGRPMAIRDEDIEVQLPIDVDDDLIESGNVDAQILRGPSEVSSHLRQVRLRQITSRIGTRLYRKSANCHPEVLWGKVNEVLSDLDQWRNAFPILAQPQNAYETTHWRDLNYYRECLKCHRLLMLLGKTGHAGEGYATPLERCQEAASQVALLYQGMRASDTLILNWTCVHDMMSASFTVLYCGLARQEAAQRGEASAEVWGQQVSRIRGTTDAVIDTLVHIATRWTTVGKHARVFRVLAGRVIDSMQSAPPGIDTVGPRTTIMPPPATDAQYEGRWQGEFGYQAEMWDTAMIAFLNEPIDLGTIDWGVVDWNAAGLFSGEDQLAD